MNLLLEGKRAFVSGGTRGIGAALCEVFAREGADVAFNYHSRDDLAEETKAKIEAHGRRALAYKVSVTDRLGIKKLVREIKEAWDGIDILVNNAAVNKPDNFATTTDKSWDWVIDTNVNSLFAVTKPFYKQMIRQRAGSILNITSIGAIRSLPTSVHYATSKAAMILDDTRNAAIKNNYGGDAGFFKAAIDIYMHDLIAKTKETGEPQMTCYAGTAGAVIFDEGTISSCENLEATGNLRDYDWNFQGAWNSPQMKARRQKAKSGCFCTHESNSYYPSLPFNPKHLIQIKKLERQMKKASKEMEKHLPQNEGLAVKV